MASIRIIKSKLEEVKQVVIQASLKHNNKDLFIGEIGVGKTTYYSFLDGQKIRTEHFKKICKYVGLNWEDIYTVEKYSSSLDSYQSIASSIIDKEPFDGRGRIEN